MADPHLSPGDSTGHRMDAIYRHQVAIYDITRKYYLLGRDRLIDDLDVPEGGSVLEIACGTGRNLIRIGQRYPQARLYGMDISGKMLEQADKTITRVGMGQRIALAQGDACQFDPQAMFGETQFDRIVFSYCLSMIPDWTAALRHAVPLLAPGGRIHLVDFGQMDRLPSLFRAGMFAWLSKFHVTPRAGTAELVSELAASNGMRGGVTSLYRDYAIIGSLEKTAPPA